MDRIGNTFSRQTKIWHSHLIRIQTFQKYIDILPTYDARKQWHESSLFLAIYNI